MPVSVTIRNRAPIAEQPGISVCVPVYNDEKYLSGCVDSLLSQDYPNVDIVLVDDGSTDSSGTICDEYAIANRGEIVVDHEKNQGPLLARRRGFELAKGDYAMCVDSDDMLFPGAVSLAGRTIAQTGADVVQFRAARSMDWQAEKAYLASDVECFFSPVEEKTSFLANLCKSTDVFQNPMAFKAIHRSCVGVDVDLSSFSELTFAEDFLQTAIVYDNASAIAELGTGIYYYRPGSGITQSYAPHMYADARRALDFVEGYAHKWEDKYGCDGLLAGLAACRLDSAAQLAEYLATHVALWAWMLLPDQEGLFIRIFNDTPRMFTMGRNEIFRYLLSSGFQSYDFGSANETINSVSGMPFEMDLIKIALELTPLVIALFVWLYWDVAGTTLWSVFIIGFFMLNIITSDSATSNFYLTLAYITCGLVEYWTPKAPANKKAWPPEQGGVR